MFIVVSLVVLLILSGRLSHLSHSAFGGAAMHKVTQCVRLIGVSIGMLGFIPASHASTIKLGQPEIYSPVQVETYFDESGDAHVQEISSDEFEGFEPLDYKKHFNLKKHNDIWLRMRVHYPERNAIVQDLAPYDWYVDIPNSLLDRVLMYEQREDGSFFPTQIAGDLVANEFWTNPSKSPLFRLRLRPGETHNVFIQINNSTRTTMTVNLVNESALFPKARLSNIIYGAISGGLLLATVYALILGFFFRDRGFLLFSAWTFVSCVTNLAYSGVLAQYMLSSSPHAVDASHGVLILLSWALSIWFVRHLCAATTSIRWQRILLFAGVLYCLAAVAFALVPRFPYGSGLIALMVPMAPMLALYTAFRSYKNNDKIAIWIIVSYAVFSLFILLIVSIIFGIVPQFVPLESIILFSQGAMVPPLLTALHARSLQQHTISLREQALGKYDALTGLLREPLLIEKIGSLGNLPVSMRSHMVLVVMDIVNLNRIALTHDSSIAEQSMLRTVIKIKRILGNIDSAARVGHSRIAFLMDHTNKEDMRAMVVELIASGLRPAKHLNPEVSLQYHFALGFLDPAHPESDESLLERLNRILDGMSNRTRRPIRFLGEHEEELKRKAQRKGASTLPGVDSVSAQSSLPPPYYLAQDAGTEENNNGNNGGNTPTEKNPPPLEATHSSSRDDSSVSNFDLDDKDTPSAHGLLKGGFGPSTIRGPFD